MISAIDECKKELGKLTGKNLVFFTRRGNDSIRLALTECRQLGKSLVLLQDQGGWITYSQYIRRLKLQEVRLKTLGGILDSEELSGYSNCILLINSMPGYHALQPMERIASMCLKNKIILVNDATGSIGTKQALVGDIILGSFGKNKPLDIGGGGFIACEWLNAVSEPELDFEILKSRIHHLGEKIACYEAVRKKIVNELSHYDIMHGAGINVIVRFKNSAEKEMLEEYCKKNSFKYTLCPRYIRVLEDAVCIEVKCLES